MDLISLKRPKSSDGEEELFRMQEEFLKSKQEPSAKVINLHNQDKHQKELSMPACSLENEKSVGKIRSVFSERRKLKAQQKMLTTSQIGSEMINPAISNAPVRDNIVDNSFDAVQNIPVAPSSVLLGNIVERKYDGEEYKVQPIDRLSSDTLTTGFPRVFVSEIKETDNTKSLFWQNVSKDKTIMKGSLASVECRPSMESNSTLVDGPWAAEIHKANLEKLNEMSEAEILEEKKKLEATLSSDLIEFLKVRKKRKEQSKGNNDNTFFGLDKVTLEKCKQYKDVENKVTADKMECDVDIDKDHESPNERMTVECENATIELPKPLTEIVEQAKEKGWVHMDTVELEKLKWMKDVPVVKNDSSPEEPYNARFDFNGLLLPFKDDSLTVDKGLHHHGDEPERPGYSLQELLHLSRSSTQQQRCIALTTLANIMEKSRKGWYDRALQPAPLTALNEKNIFLLLRFSLDDTSVAIVTATLQALRAFLYSEADEVCLDRLLGWGDYVEPTLATSLTDVNDINNLKDHELAQLDTVTAALRSDIVLRIRYILSEMQPPPIGVTAALEILIRLARQSHETALNIACTPHLLDIIIRHFMPLTVNRLMTENVIDNAYGVPIATAIRLCRILICYGGKPVAEKLYNLKAAHSIVSYISSDTSKHGIHLCIESLRLWKLLLNRGIALESISGAQLTLVSQLRLLLSNYDLGKMSELSCEYAAALVAVSSCEASLRKEISPLLSKWSTQLATISSPTWGNTKLVAESLIAANDISSMRTSWMLNVNIFSNLGSTSNLLSNCILAIERDPSSLPSLSVLTQDGQLQPVVSQHCCIPFLATILNAFHKSLCKAEIQIIFNEPQFDKYIHRLETTEWCLERSWYTRTELFLVTAIIRAGVLLGNNLNIETRQLIWKISVKLISALPADAPLVVKEMLTVVLCNEKLKLEVLLRELNDLKLNVNVKNIEFDLSQNLTLLYEDYIMRNETWDRAAMPKDWLYLPLVNLYTKCRNNYNCSADDERIITAVLSLEFTLPELVQRLSPSLRFSRLSLVYLCDASFLNKSLSFLLTKVVTNLLQSHYKRFDFTADVPGLSSFTDLFTALCEHFCAISYGDHGFAMVLLVPIAQRHDVHYRKLLWSEHAGTLRSLGLPLEKLVIPLKEYLYPVEDDISLIDCYMSALVRGTVKREWCPIGYTIAMHHVAMYLKGTTNLAIRMRMQVGKLENLNLRNELIHYVPPEL